MATERHEHQHWANEQIAALIELGVNPIDSQRAVDWVLANLPDGEDPATYIFPAYVLYEDPASPENIRDARADWYAAEHISARWKRLLDAKEEVK